MLAIQLASHLRKAFDIELTIANLFESADLAGLAAAVDAALGELGRLGIRFEDVELPGWEAAAAAVSVLIRCEAAAEHRTVLAERGGDLIPEVRERLEAGRVTSAPDYVEARRAAGRLAFALLDRLRRHDLLVLPGRDQTAPRMEPGGRLLDPPSSRNYLSPLNPAGVPALVVPCGFERRDGRDLPIGLQLVGRAWDEGRLLQVAHAFQQATDWHRRRPPLDP